MLLDDEHPGAHAADRELLVTLDARGFGRNVATEQRQQRLHRIGRPLGMDLSRRPHPAHDRQLAGLGDHGLGVHRPAGGRTQRLVTSG
jgi:hypothetical protein